MTRHLNISPLHRRDHARATTPRGTCTAAEGLDAETFRGFQLAGELFLLTSFFIEPNAHASAERRRGFGRNGKALHACAGSLAAASLVRVAHSASIGHFRQDSPTLRQPERREFRSEKEVAPQVGLEPTTLRLTAERLVAASRCKHKTWTRQNLVFPEIGGTLGVLS